MNPAYIRIALRYGIGAAMMGSPVIGQQLAADPDIVFAVSGLAGLAVEGFYAASKRIGGRL
ncbi:hypothetical protein [Roseibium album]|uniref:hypothetical protein n=1 Tax=Roseibium album TaxID=311410 RepID=UPI003BB00DEA